MTSGFDWEGYEAFFMTLESMDRATLDARAILDLNARLKSLEGWRKYLERLDTIIDDRSRRIEELEERINRLEGIEVQRRIMESGGPVLEVDMDDGKGED